MQSNFSVISSFFKPISLEEKYSLFVKLSVIEISFAATGDSLLFFFCVKTNKNGFKETIQIFSCDVRTSEGLY